MACVASSKTTGHQHTIVVKVANRVEFVMDLMTNLRLTYFLNVVCAWRCCLLRLCVCAACANANGSEEKLIARSGHAVQQLQGCVIAK